MTKRLRALLYTNHKNQLTVIYSANIVKKRILYFQQVLKIWSIEITANQKWW